MNFQRLFGVIASNVDETANKIGVALGTMIENRSSSYLGDYSLCHPFLDSKIFVYANSDPMFRKGIDPENEQYFEPDYDAYGVLVKAYCTANGLKQLHDLLEILSLNPVVIRTNDIKGDDR